MHLLIFQEIATISKHAANLDFRIAVATWCSYKAAHLPCRRDIHGSVVPDPGHGSPLATGALQKHHSLNRDITGSAKCPPEKLTS